LQNLEKLDEEPAGIIVIAICTILCAIIFIARKSAQAKDCLDSDHWLFIPYSFQQRHLE